MVNIKINEQGSTVTPYEGNAEYGYAILCTEDNVPAKFAMQFDKTSTFEENIEPFIKRAGKDGPVLMSEGRRIVRFTEYDPSGHNADVRVQHDNMDEVKAYNLAQKSAKADLG